MRATKSNHIVVAFALLALFAGSTNDDPSSVRGATVGDGANNTAGAHYSTIAGGTQNTIRLSNDLPATGGGEHNNIQTNASSATIGGAP